MSKPLTILRSWQGSGWWVKVFDEEKPIRVNAASAAPTGEIALPLEDVAELASALTEAVGFCRNRDSTKEEQYGHAP